MAKTQEPLATFQTLDYFLEKWSCKLVPVSIAFTRGTSIRYLPKMARCRL